MTKTFVESPGGWRPNRRIRITLDITLDVPGGYGRESGRDEASEVEERLVWYVAENESGGCKTLSETLVVDYADLEEPAA